MSYSPESVRNTSVGDQAANVDALGFEPYVIAIAEFLLNPETKPPLTLSIEGEWGSGKSSFMKQLEKYLREKGKQRTVWFNAWRHDKAEAVWAAFALSFIKQISTPQGYKDLPRAIKGYCKLQYLRFNREKGLFEVIKALPLILFVICTAIAIPFILAIYGVKGINELVRVTTSQDDLWKQIGAAFNLLFAVGGLTLSGTGLIAGIRSLFGNFQKLLVSPKNNLIKYLEAPDYKKQSAFIEEFHEDFAKIVKAYIGESRVYVFIDDLDRCEHPKSADLMQAMNLMIADDPSVVFILGMDREKVAASLAVKYESIFRYLPSENSDIDPDILERYSTNKGLAYGYTFIEKFVQLPFQIPQPSPDNFKQFIIQLGTSKTSESDKNPISQTQHNLLPPFKGLLGGILQPFQGMLKPFKGKIEKTGKMGEIPSSNTQQTETITANLELTAEVQQQAIEIKRSEIIQLSFDSDSQTVRNVVMMVAPALDYNPRRIKQFLNLFRLKVSIASKTGLFDELGRGGNVIEDHLTFEQLGKFIAISLKWPLFLFELDSDNQLFEKCFKCQLRTQHDCNQSIKEMFIDRDRNTLLYWLNQDKFRELLAYGGYFEVGLDNSILDWKFSLKEVNVKKLLQVSPKVVRQNTNLDQQTRTAQVQITGLSADFNIEMVDIPAGNFMMGSDENTREKPIHKVFVNAFKIGKYPITQEQYEIVMKSNPSSFKGNPKNPVENVNWNDAQLFCQKLTQLSGQIYRLPTEAEWEYACRAGTQTRYYFGDDETQLENYAWYKNNAKGITHLVGQKNPNNWEIYDMSGNVWEWCADKWKNNYAKDNNKDYSSNLEFNDDDFVVVRGGSWEYNSERCRSAYRAGEKAGIRFSGIGFRVVSSQNI